MSGHRLRRAAVAGVLVGVLALTGCFGGDDDDDQGGNETVTLTVLSWQPGGKPFWEKTIADFERAHPNIKIKEQVAPYTNYYQRIGALAKSNSGPDVLTLDSGSNTAVTYKDLFQPIDEYVDSGLISKINGQAYSCPDFDCSKGSLGLNFFLQGHLFYVNNRLLKQFGGDPAHPPTTWSEFAAVCDAAVEAGKACVAAGAKDIGGLLWYTSFTQGAASTEDCRGLADGTVKPTDPKFQWPYEAWKIAADRGWFQPGVAGATAGQQALATFVAGDAVFYVGLLGGAADWRALEKVGKNLGVMPAPAPEPDNPVPGLSPGPLSQSLNATGGATIGITKFTEHPKEAAEFAKYLVRPEVQLDQVKIGGGFPSVRSLDVKAVGNPTFTRLFELTNQSKGTCAPWIPSAMISAETAQTQAILAGKATPREAAEATEAALAKAGIG